MQLDCSLTEFLVDYFGAALIVVNLRFVNGMQLSCCYHHGLCCV